MLLPNKFLKVLLQVHSSRLSTLIHGSLNPGGKDNGENDEGNESPPGRGYLLVAGIDPIQISPDGINPECHRLFLRILGRRLLMRASAHSTA